MKMEKRGGWYTVWRQCYGDDEKSYGHVVRARLIVQGPASSGLEQWTQGGAATFWKLFRRGTAELKNCKCVCQSPRELAINMQ
jgi:hypothetical protein